MRLDDVRAAGWTVTGPQKELDRDASGLLWVHATKRFTGSEQFTAIMNEINGPNGIFRDFRLVRSTGFAKVTYTVTGTIDPARGLDSFSDPEVAQLLGGNALGRPTADVLKDAANASLVLAVELPGDVKGSADRVDGGRAEWDVALGGAPTAIAVHSDDVQGAARRWAAVAVVLAVAAVAAVVLALVRRAPRGPRRIDGARRAPLARAPAPAGRGPGTGDRARSPTVRGAAARGGRRRTSRGCRRIRAARSASRWWYSTRWASCIATPTMSRRC